MKLGQSGSWCRCLLLAGALAAVAVTGCQSTIGGQTLPSAYYLEDDVQYFPAGPEFQLPNTVRAHERYRLEQQGLQDGFGVPIP
jgi:hypothetical protein